MFFLQMLILLRFVFDAELQNATPSHVRASMTSVVTFLARVMGIGVALGFAWLARRFGDVVGLRYSGIILLIGGLLMLLKKPIFRRTRAAQPLPDELPE